MNYIYHVNGEDREPTCEEWNQLAEQMLTMAGLVKTESREVIQNAGSN